MKSVLMIDDDLGFLFWLGKALVAAGYTPFPALGVPEATGLLAEFSLSVDILIVNPSLPGAPDFVQSLRHHREDLKVVTVSEGAAAYGSQLQPDATWEKPRGTSEETEWTSMLRGMLFELWLLTRGLSLSTRQPRSLELSIK
jgi:hypothetical protein